MHHVEPFSRRDPERSRRGESAGEIPSAVGEGSGNAVNRLNASLIAYAALGVLTWATISDHRIRGVTLAILAMFAVKSWVRRKDALPPDEGRDAE